MPYIDAQPADLNTIFIRKGIELNSFFNSLGAKGGDIITNINGTPITLENMRTIIGREFWLGSGNGYYNDGPKGWKGDNPFGQGRDPYLQRSKHS